MKHKNNIHDWASEHRLLFFRRGNINNYSQNPDSNNESMAPTSSREEFERKREELHRRKDNIIKRIEKIQERSSNKQEWENYKQRFTRDFEYWNINYERIAAGHKEAFQANLDNVLQRYEYQVSGSESVKNGRQQEGTAQALGQLERVHGNTWAVELPRGANIGFKFDTYVNWQYLQSDTVSMGDLGMNGFRVYRDPQNRNRIIIQSNWPFQYSLNGQIMTQREQSTSSKPEKTSSEIPQKVRQAPIDNAPQRSQRNKTDELKPKQETEFEQAKKNAAKTYAIDRWAELPSGIGKRGWQYRYESKTDTLYARTYVIDQWGRTAEYNTKLNDINNTWITIAHPVFQDKPAPVQENQRQQPQRQDTVAATIKPTPKPEPIQPEHQRTVPKQEPKRVDPKIQLKPETQTPIPPVPSKTTPQPEPRQRTPEPQRNPEPQKPRPKQSTPEKSQEEVRDAFRKTAKSFQKNTDTYTSLLFTTGFPLSVRFEKEHLQKFDSIFGNSDPAYQKEIQSRLQHLDKQLTQWYAKKEQNRRVKEKLPTLIEGKTFYGISMKVEPAGNPSVSLLKFIAPSRYADDKYPIRSSAEVDFLIGLELEEISDANLEERVMNHIKEQCWKLMKEYLTSQFKYYSAGGYKIDVEVGETNIVFKLNDKELHTVALSRDTGIPDVAAITKEVNEKVKGIRSTELADKMPKSISGLEVRWDRKETVTLWKKWDDGREGSVGSPIALGRGNPDDVVQQLTTKIEKDIAPSVIDYAHYKIWADEPKTKEMQKRYGIDWKFGKGGINFYRDTSEDFGIYRRSESEPFTSLKADDYKTLDGLVAQHEKSIGNRIEGWKKEAARHDLRLVLHHETAKQSGYTIKAMLINRYGNPVASIGVDTQKDTNENDKTVLEGITGYAEKVSNVLRSLAEVKAQPTENVIQFKDRFLAVYERYYDIAVKQIDSSTHYKSTTEDWPPSPNSFKELDGYVLNWKWQHVRKGIADANLPSELRGALLRLYQVGDPVYDPNRKEMETFADGKKIERKEAEAGEKFVLALPQPPLKEGDVIHLQINGKAIDLPLIVQKALNRDFLHADTTPLKKEGYEEMVSVDLGLGAGYDRVFVTSERPMRINVKVGRHEKEFAYDIPKTVGDYTLQKQPDTSVRVFNKENKLIAVITDIDKKDMQIWFPDAVGDKKYGKVENIGQFSALSSLNWYMERATERVNKARDLDKKQKALVEQFAKTTTLGLHYSGRSYHEWKDQVQDKTYKLESVRATEPTWLIKEGNITLGKAYLRLNRHEDDYDVVLQDPAGKEMEEYRAFEYFQKDAVLTLLIARNSKNPIELHEGKRLALEIGNTIVLHKGIELSFNNGGALAFGWDRDLYPAHDLGNGLMTWGARTDIEADQIVVRNNTYTLYKDGKAVAEIAKSIVGNEVQFNIKKDGKDYATLRLPPKAK